MVAFSELRLSVEKCREVLGPECTLSDAELEDLRDQLYVLAELAVELFRSDTGNPGEARCLSKH